MYHHHHSQQQGPQPFPNGPRPPHHQPPPNQHQNRSPSNMLSQVMGFQFPRPTQLPDELESALAIRGARDMDHRLMDHMNRPNQHQSQGSGSGISQHGGYSTNPITLTTDNQPSHQQGVDWSSYQPPNKLFAGPQTGASHQSQRQQGPQQQPQSSNAGTNIPSWTAPANDSPSPQARQPHAGGSGGSGDGQALYTPESAGSILASFGLSNEDLEVLSHYPDDQLTPDTLPFILRDIQINKSGSQKIVASSSSSSSSFSRSMHDMPLPPSQSSPPARSCSPEVPSLLTVTQTAGKVIDYGHASRAKDESSTRETFKREPLSSERTVKMYPSSLSSSSAPKLDKAERRQVRLEHSESSKHGDQDYRRTSSDVRKSNRSPGREFPPSSKSRNLDRDYRRDGPKSRPSSETKSDASRRSLSSTSGSKPPSSKKLPTPTMISDFSAMSPKVYPHTCSLCHTQCEQEKDWVDHVNTVNHTAACRDLRNKYPDWKPNLPSRSGRYGSRALWDPKDHSPSQSVSRSLSGSPDHSPPRSKYRAGPHPHWLHPRPYSPHRQTRHQHYTEHHHLERSHSGSRSPSHSYRSSRDHQPERREGESSVGSSRSGVKRPHDDSAKFSTDSSRHLSSAKAGHGTKHGPLQSTKTVKSWTKPGTKPTKMASSKAADTSSKLPPAKKKKKVATPTCLDWSVADRLVYLTGIPKDASEQEVTDLVGSFGKINNVILMPCSGEESEKGEGQKASVCMLTAEDAHALAHSTNLSIRDQQITASTAKKPEAGQSSDGNSKSAPAQDRGAFGEGHGAEADQKTYSEKGVVLITGFPESGWSESDVIQLIQPFGTPSDIIQATQLGKVLVSVPDKEIAQEIVKVHSFKPAKIMESELKMIHLKQRIGLSTPVALYNLLMGSEDPLESSVPVSWSSLLMISNVPNTPSGSSEVQKLVRRFGTVIKTLVLNNMVICEMATAAMAWSVYKRFQSFPCIIQNNPLFFSRKPDPKASTQTKVITAYLDPSEDTPANDKESQAAAVATGEELAHQKDFESTCEGIEIDSDVKDEKMTSTEKMVGEDGALGENESKDDETKKVELTLSLSKDSAATESDFNTDVMEKPSEMETAEVISASTVGNEKTIVGEETKQTSKEPAMPALPQVTQEMVNALLVECRTRTSSHSTNIAASTNGEQEEPQRKKEKSEKAADQTKEPDKKNMEEEGKKQEMERNEREARKEREARERERKEKERRAWEKEERNKREREREERARRERRERERRQRKRPYVEVLPGSRMSCKLEGHEKSSWRDEQHSSTKQVEEEEESDDFPFNMSDFVTVDEVGDVADLPSSPPPSGPMETSEGGEDAPTPVQQDTSEPMEVHTETATSDASVTLMKSDERQSDLECVTVPRADTPSHLTPSQDIIAAASPSLPSQAEPSPGADVTPETEAALESTPDIEPLPVPADDTSADPDESADLSSDRPATVVTSEDEKEGSALSDSQAQKEEVMSDRAEEQEEMSCEEDKETPSPAVESGKPKTSDDKTNGKEESLMKKFKKDTPMSTDCPLPPFNPNNPVGMEFLVPKTGFFCKVCNRFFSGTKEAEINHCKTLKHYESLQKFMQTRKLENVTVKPDSI